MKLKYKFNEIVRIDKEFVPINEEVDLEVEEGSYESHRKEALEEAKKRYVSKYADFVSRFGEEI